MCQSHTGRLTGLWFLPKPAFGLNTNDDDDDDKLDNGEMSKYVYQEENSVHLRNLVEVLTLKNSIWGLREPWVKTWCPDTCYIAVNNYLKSEKKLCKYKINLFVNILSHCTKNTILELTVHD